MSELRGAIKLAFYRSGAAALLHRLRNRDALTVLMFHRVLPSGDPGWSTADPAYTITTELLAEVLRFARQHYRVIDLSELLDGQPLRPPRAAPPLLLSFDDGWADTALHALPQLRAAGLSAVIFVVADAVGRRQPFWEEQVMGAWRLGRIEVERWQQVWSAVASGPPRAMAWEQVAAIRELTRALRLLDRPRREQLLATLGAALELPSEPLMLSRDQLRTLHEAGMHIGSHGMTHTPLDVSQDLASELEGSRQQLADLLAAGPEGTPRVLSLPHGRIRPGLAARAREAGYRLVFSSDSVLNTGNPAPTLLGRVGIKLRETTVAGGPLRPELLAWKLFLQPRRALSEGSVSVR